ncbi:hypothetical protein BDW60DRAFT_201074 [Aspergillus nidulans var. acristatus]
MARNLTSILLNKSPLSVWSSNAIDRVRQVLSSWARRSCSRARARVAAGPSSPSWGSLCSHQSPCTSMLSSAASWAVVS